jgi:hypothetical protein
VWVQCEGFVGFAFAKFASFCTFAQDDILDTRLNFSDSILAIKVDVELN